MLVSFKEKKKLNPSIGWGLFYQLSSNFKQNNHFTSFHYPKISSILRMWFFVPHNQRHLDFNKDNLDFQSFTKCNQKVPLVYANRRFIRRQLFYSFSRENVFTIRPNYQLYWSFLRLQLNNANGLFYRSHIRISKWVEVFANHVFNKKLSPLEIFFFGKSRRTVGNIFLKNKYTGRQNKPIAALGVYNRGFNWNLRV